MVLFASVKNSYVLQNLLLGNIGVGDEAFLVYTVVYL